MHTFLTEFGVFLTTYLTLLSFRWGITYISTYAATMEEVETHCTTKTKMSVLSHSLNENDVLFVSSANHCGNIVPHGYTCSFISYKNRTANKKALATRPTDRPTDRRSSAYEPSRAVSATVHRFGTAYSTMCYGM